MLLKVWTKSVSDIIFLFHCKNTAEISALEKDLDISRLSSHKLFEVASK